MKKKKVAVIELHDLFRDVLSEHKHLSPAEVVPEESYGDVVGYPYGISYVGLSEVLSNFVALLEAERIENAEELYNRVIKDLEKAKVDIDNTIVDIDN
jgi:hypothetical protein